MSKDKHNKAYKVLSNERSKTIARNLARIDGRDEPAKPAHEDSRCLACHSIPGLPEPAYAELGKARRLNDGVQCESCHGSADGWLREHTQVDAWQKKTPEQKKSLGMNDMKELWARAKVCAGCHVGTSGGEQVVARDAFHDIMAAGHPPLGGDYNPAAKFEFSNFHATLGDRGARHWIEWDKSPDFDVRLWLSGQVAAAQTALELLAGRAKAAATGKAPWPEFAEYECSACHHDLDEPSWPQKRGYGSRRPGSLPWGTWYFIMVKGLPGMEQGSGKAIVEQLDVLEKLMNEPYPDANKVANAAGLAAAALGKWWASDGMKGLKTQELERIIKEWTKAGQNTERLDRDAATQLYLALVALNETAKNAKVRDSLKSVIQRLDTRPRDYEPEKFREELQKLQSQLGQ